MLGHGLDAQMTAVDPIRSTHARKARRQALGQAMRMYQVQQAHVDECSRGVPRAGARLSRVVRLQQLRRGAGQDVCRHAHLRAEDLRTVPHCRCVEQYYCVTDGMLSTEEALAIAAAPVMGSMMG